MCKFQAAVNRYIIVTPVSIAKQLASISTIICHSVIFLFVVLGVIVLNWIENMTLFCRLESPESGYFQVSFFF